MVAIFQIEKLLIGNTLEVLSGNRQWVAKLPTSGELFVDMRKIEKRAKNIRLLDGDDWKNDREALTAARKKLREVVVEANLVELHYLLALLECLEELDDNLDEIEKGIQRDREITVKFDG